MRPNNRQRPRGGRNGGGSSGGGGGGGSGGGGPHHHKQHHNPNRPPNRNQLFDNSGPDVRVRGNAHQVFDKYQALAREAGTSGDRILAESYWQYAEHYFRMIQTMGIGGGFGNRNNQGWGEGPEDGQQGGPQQQGGQGGPQQGNGGDYNQGGGNQGGGERNNGNANSPAAQATRPEPEQDPGLGGVAFLQTGRGASSERDPSADEQPEIPEFTPTGRRG